MERTGEFGNSGVSVSAGLRGECLLKKPPGLQLLRWTSRRSLKNFNQRRSTTMPFVCNHRDANLPSAIRTRFSSFLHKRSSCCIIICRRTHSSSTNFHCVVAKICASSYRFLRSRPPLLFGEELVLCIPFGYTVPFVDFNGFGAEFATAYITTGRSGRAWSSR